MRRNFNLDISGVAGFFGGNVSVSAMATVHVYRGRTFLGWYNQPGSYEIAQRYGQLSRSRLWDALYPGDNVDPAVLFEYDGTEGPKFTAVHSGTTLSKTGHVASLFLEECAKLKAVAKKPPSMRITTPGFVSIVNLPYAPEQTERPRLKRYWHVTTFFAFLAMLSSFATCALCGFIGDWFCFASILTGIVSSGISCFVIGMGELTFHHPKAAAGAPHGDGLLDNGAAELVVIKGLEDAVNSITRGRFSFDYASAPEYHAIGCCSVLLTLQFIAQLLLIPQGTIHGQLLFLASLAGSWIYNSALSSLDKRNIQGRILVHEVLRIPEESGCMERYELGTRTSTVVFTLLLLAPAPREDLKKILDELLPNDTPTWKTLKSRVLDGIEVGFSNNDTQDFHFNLPPAGGEDAKLLETLYGDATAAAETYRIYRARQREVHSPTDSTAGSTQQDQ
ncbi:hypothetical protein C8Q78DRAFT_420085 [Trametes maxima]|nr:hypothetical protein C8Q78DRAFT_420085 [Trametes maxima]